VQKAQPTSLDDFYDITILVFDASSKKAKLPLVQFVKF
jgi:hypothetical protein